jgi:methionine synthase II (cobalamin-independent)
MMLQYSPPLPCLKPDVTQKNLSYDPDCDRPSALLLFYEKLLSQDSAFFSLVPEYAEGFYRLLQEIPRSSPHHDILKGQIVGPITLGLGVKSSADQFLIHDSELMDAVIRGLAQQAINQVKRFENLEKKAVIFIDEPSLSGYGSAFSPLSREAVLEILEGTIAPIREQTEALIGLHCCGNTDWALLLSLNLDIINLDAFGFSESFSLYPKEIKAFLEKGGMIAWGIVPTSDYTGKETTPLLLDRLAGTFQTLLSKGLDRERLYTQALLTPACGMGSLSPQTARNLLSLLSETSQMAKERFGLG